MGVFGVGVDKGALKNVVDFFRLPPTCTQGNPSRVNFGMLLFQRGPGSVRFGYGLKMERFQRFRFSVPAVPQKKGFSVFQYSLTGKEGSGSGFGSWKTVPAVPVPRSVPGKTVPTVPVSGSGSVPEPPCFF